MMSQSNKNELLLGFLLQVEHITLVIHGMLLALTNLWWIKRITIGFSSEILATFFHSMDGKKGKSTLKTIYS
jgi:hypothetical protein